NNCDGQIDEDIGDVYYRDGDGDGYGTEEGATLLCTLEEGYSTEIGDCDDDNNTVFPGVEEMCDGLDNDCDGETDEDVGNAFYVDSDGDGFGDSTQEIFSCSRPEGYIENDWDCNDADDSIFPGAVELCDGIDNNCDETIDGSDVTDGSLWYADSDGDGFGSLSDVVQSCEQPTGYDDNYNDCNDTDASVSGSATWYFDYDQDGYGDAAYSVSICQQPSGFVSNDDDCNDSDALQNPTSDWYLDLDGDGYGANISVTQCEQPTGFVMNDSDCDDTEELAYTGATEVCDYVDNDCNGSIDENVLEDWYLDYDQDGYGDDDTFQEACEAPSSYHVNAGGDCDDEDPAYSPGVAEGCSGLDLNCDGLIDNDVDLDGYSDATCGGSDCDDSDATIIPEPNGTCAIGESCLDILNSGKSVGDGTYGVDPDGYGIGNDPFDAECDMTTDGGGWTGISFINAHTSLSGSLNARDLAGIEGVDLTFGPYTRDGSGSHYYFYEFDFASTYNEFYLSDWTVLAYTAYGHTSEVCGSIVSWTGGYTNNGDIALGSPDDSGPVASMYAGTISGCLFECVSCETDWPAGNQIYTVGSNADALRIAWGEEGSQSEGWYPWYSGLVYLR
ncbi:MAG: MopE-related protein, partial [Myxococcota bacterium]|nr:MopE-related protein [Myxococcota bacterium]